MDFRLDSSLLQRHSSHYHYDLQNNFSIIIILPFKKLFQFIFLKLFFPFLFYKFKKKWKELDNRVNFKIIIFINLELIVAYDSAVVNVDDENEVNYCVSSHAVMIFPHKHKMVNQQDLLR